jgi:hypothetical protein
MQLLDETYMRETEQAASEGREIFVYFGLRIAGQVASLCPLLIVFAIISD